jgi:hypothetical protein
VPPVRPNRATTRLDDLENPLVRRRSSMTKAQREAQVQAYRALQEALDRRDNGGRNTTPADGRGVDGRGADDRDTMPAAVWPQPTARRSRG